jgi:hypothetical protein
MKDVNDLDAVSESTLRRALRLEADEQVPRLDATAIAALAERRTTVERLLRILRGVALVGVSLGIEAVVAIAAFTALADLDPSSLYGLALASIAGLVEQLVPLARFAMDPAVATATLAAVIFATIYERSFERESVRVEAS